MERLWAFKRINFLLKNNDCKKAVDKINHPPNFYPFEDLWSTTPTTTTTKKPEEENVCFQNAVKLAKKYNFATLITSLVIEANNEYIR